MKILRKMLVILEVIIVINIIALGVRNIGVIAESRFLREKPVKVGALLYSFDDYYISEVRKSLEKIQKENEGKVEFTFFDGKNNLAIQNQIINNEFPNNFDLLLVHLVGNKEEQIKSIIDKIRPQNIPLILFVETEPKIIELIKSYGKAIIIATDVNQSGILEGKILVDLWNADKEAIDKNRDNVLQYIMLQGKSNSPDAIARTKNTISAINNAGIKTEELELVNADFNKELAKNAVESLFLRYDGRIEAIISNNDTMAIGAIEALQKYGYNEGDKRKTIAVVGNDAIPEAQELIKKGFMAGTVVQDPTEMAEAIYKVGINMVFNENPLEGTEYKFDETGVVIKLPYREYTE